jgi:Chaperone of endosialidase
MDIKKLDRAALKSYFVKNAVPTESNFADLVDALINQKEDGIAKLPGEPLSVQADGNDTSQKKAINFYKSFADPKPAWTLSLNPRADPNNAATAKPGWSVGDADGRSKLFIDQATGRVGIGTTTPAEALEVSGRAKLGTSIAGSWPADARYAFFGVSTLDQAAGGNYALLQGSSDGPGRTFLNSPYEIRFRIANADHMILANGGNVGIGTVAPAVKLEVNGAALIGNGGNYAPNNGRMSPGSLTIGGINANFGGGSGWTANTAGLLFETASNTEIAVHDSGTRIASLMYYEGDAVNRITIGRDMGWGVIGQVAVNGAIVAGNSDLYFTKTDHRHSGFGNTAGYAAIENAADYTSLMILGRSGTPVGRQVQLWDYLKVNGTFVNNSDERMKRDVTDLEYGLKEIMQLRPVSFNWKDIPNPHKSIGLIAQEVMPVIGEAVYQDESGGNGSLSIAYTSLIPALINAVKELAAEVERLSARTAA